MSYKEYLNSDHWKEISEERRKLDFYECYFCGCKDNLNVHHLTYERKGAEALSDLVTLCRSCHLKIHSLNIKINKSSDYEDKPKFEEFLLSDEAIHKYADSEKYYVKPYSPLSYIETPRGKKAFPLACCCDFLFSRLIDFFDFYDSGVSAYLNNTKKSFIYGNKTGSLYLVFFSNTEFNMAKEKLEKYSIGPIFRKFNCELVISKHDYDFEEF